MIKTSTYLYLDSKTRGYGYFGLAPPIGVAQYGGDGVGCDIQIEDGRDTTLKLDEASFELVECPTTLSTDDFYKIQQEDSDLKEKYEQEVTEFVKAKLGCDKIVCFHSQVRNAQKEGKSGGVQGYAVGGPHTDSSALSGDEVALHTLADQKEDASKYKRYLYLNLWRNISEDPIEDFPLAMLDERTTVKPDDYLSRDLFMPKDYHIVQYGLNARHASQHKWYYFPKMTKSEGILFKQIDSDWTLSGRTCFHMAVEDPNAPKNAKPRESIELRMICFWEEAAVNSMPSKKTVASSGKSENPASLVGIQSASSIQLVVTLLTRLPLLGYLFQAALSNPLVSILFAIFASSFKEYPPYSGNAEDYIAGVQTSMGFFSQWPSFAKTGVEKQLKGKSERVGAEIITKIIVDDSTGHLKMKKFKADQKKAILDACLANEEYMNTVRKQVGSLFA
mmetsp:Transcript_21099/g.36288  ORF Transcript_21099/g.36288 Transcript_21099/m.36288 type:complete len:448 (-) Transcript_21099:1349-2692(-)|eukprot:CAMPEP_0183741926 /NCGR_PEP_ID=MMETSP0737-20130205/63499_1 /TAXON_ID=385413 /ORGANISM="Thalassiosira miniscula, Strain CCMP1093" /LENGTH=447 /DNA_ID=CAMNT_0025977425 /DNA_START=42 /DNA_END=1385 /DNA_ORIENTATION=-